MEWRGSSRRIELVVEMSPGDSNAGRKFRFRSARHDAGALSQALAKACPGIHEIKAAPKMTAWTARIMATFSYSRKAQCFLW